MPNQVLIVAGEAAARQPAEIVRLLELNPIIVDNEEEAIRLLGQGEFRLVAVSGRAAWHRVRAAAETTQPLTRVLELPETNGEDTAVRRMMVRYLQPPRAEQPRFSADGRHRFLSSILESFTATLDLGEAVRRIVTITREELKADRAWLLHPVTETSDSTRVALAVSGPGVPALADEAGAVPLVRSRALIGRAMDCGGPVVVREGDPDLDPDLASRFQIRSEMVQVLRPREGEPWAFGVHQCDTNREWTAEEMALFTEIGRLATMALSHSLLQSRAVREMAKVSAILDQIPDAAAIYDASGNLERMNSAAQNEPETLIASDAARRQETNGPRRATGEAHSTEELPSIRALRGETVNAEYVIRDAGGDDDRVVNVRAAPIRDERGRIIGSVVLSRDITGERQTAEREGRRRRRADCLANLGLETLIVQPAFENLDEPARRVAEAVAGSVRVYLYRPNSALLELVGFASTAGEAESFRRYFTDHPYRPGEGLPGTVFHIGRPLHFYDIRGNAVIDFARDGEERRVKDAMREQSLIACPIESYGERIGALVISQSDARRNLDAEDLEFAQSVAERIGAASHIHRLTRMSLEGHRAAEDLARREVDARVRLEAVLETAPIGIAVVSADELRFELANARFMDFAAEFGSIAPDTKVIGLSAGDVIGGFSKTLKQVAESGETRIEEALEMGPAANSKYFNRIISASRGRFSGTTQSLTVLIQDVTEQVRANREIEGLARLMAERSARLDSILGSMVDGLWVYDATGSVVDVNQAALTMFGLGSRTEAVEPGTFDGFNLRYPDGRPVPSDEYPQARALCGRILPDYLAIGRHMITGKDIDLSIAAAPIESNGIVGAVLVIRDITGLQELDRKKDEFLSVASHELRTPLTTIKGYTQLLDQTINELPPGERSTYLTAVLGEIDRMMGLISELLDVSRIETNRLQIHPQPIHWIEFIERRVSAFRIQNPGRTINFAREAEEQIVSADPDRVRQVIDNLLSNAIKYSPDGTEIEVVVRLSENAIETAVIDQGIGIPRDEIPQLFERFHRARNVSSRYYGGLGLGLYIARAIVEAHRGSILVESDEGRGSVFTLKLPMAQ